MCVKIWSESNKEKGEVEFSLMLITVWLDLDKEIRRRGSPTTISTTIESFAVQVLLYVCTYYYCTVVVSCFAIRVRSPATLPLHYPAELLFRIRLLFTTVYPLPPPFIHFAGNVSVLHHHYALRVRTTPTPLRLQSSSSASDRWFVALLSRFVFKLDVCEARGRVCLWLWSDMCSSGLCATQDDNEKHRKQPKVQEVDFGILPGKEATLYKQCK